jgi:hypothetical protein
VKLEEFRVVFLIVVAVIALLAASPALSRLLVYPRTDFFTELWLLGPNHMAENYPYDIVRGQNYSVFLGVANQLGYTAYYLVEVKFRNMSQSEPTSFGPVDNRTPSNLPSLYNVSAFVADQGTWELPLTFSFNYAYNSSASRVEFGNLTLNGALSSIRNCTIAWNSHAHEFAGELFFELWIYNETISNFNFHGRFVSLHLNMTV